MVLDSSGQRQKDGNGEEQPQIPFGDDNRNGKDRK
jgi:hypothetical protein